MSGLIDAAYRAGNSLTDVLILLLSPGSQYSNGGALQRLRAWKSWVEMT